MEIVIEEEICENEEFLESFKNFFMVKFLLWSEELKVEECVCERFVNVVFIRVEDVKLWK